MKRESRVFEYFIGFAMRLGETNEMAAQKVKIYIEGKHKQQCSISKAIAIYYIYASHREKDETLSIRK